MSRHHDAIKNDKRWHAARRACLDRDGHRCVQCGASDDLQADHITPLEAGGDAFALDNLQTLCGYPSFDGSAAINCNGKKSNSIISRKNWFNPKWLDRL